ncbi:MAG: VCBS repeat-containing protein, partial [Burkholderiales bacterium]|nr:VCBS repeat-containing protein [Burkholderiales bacterium]
EDGPGLPPDCDGTRLRFPIEEGAQLVDWNNDGRFDLVVHHWVCGPSLYELVQTLGTDSRFVQRRCAIGRTQCVPMFSSGAPRYEAVRFTGNYGVKLQDLDGDGFVDVVVRGRPREPGMSKPQGAIVYRNTGSAFESVDAKRLAGLRDGRAGSVAFADFDRDGRIDVVYPTRRGTRVLLNRSPRDRTAGTMYVEVLGANGERNQFGRVVAFDVPGIGRKIMRVVDGGSGYLAQDEYVVLAPTAVAAPHRASVAFRASPDVPNRIVEFDIRPGEFARVYEPSREHPRGRIEMSRMPPRQAKCKRQPEAVLTLRS